MEVYECVRARRTIRKFKGDAVPDAVIEKVLHAGRLAPSSRNQQPWHFIVIRERDTLKALGEVATSGTCVADAPLAVAVVMENADSAFLDAGRAIQQMELVAWAEGLGTCFVGLTLRGQEKVVKEMLGIPSEMDLITLLPFGYRTDSVGRGGRPKKSLSEITHGESFDEPYEH